VPQGQLRIFENKPFSRFAAKDRLADEDLRTAIADVEHGRVDANLGGGVIKETTRNNSDICHA
jgi:hypothetical protein